MDFLAGEIGELGDGSVAWLGLSRASCRTKLNTAEVGRAVQFKKWAKEKTAKNRPRMVDKDLTKSHVLFNYLLFSLAGKSSLLALRD